MNSALFRLPVIKPYDFDDDIIKQCRQTGEPRVKVCRIEHPIVVIGRGTKPEIELNVENILEDGVDVYLRYGGGCSVVIDEGNIIVSVVLPVEGFTQNRYYFDKISDWIRVSLVNLGIPGVVRDGTSDLSIHGRKISGSCIYNSLDYLYYSATILLQPVTSLMERYLKHPPREPEYRGGRKHTDFVTELKKYTDIDIEELILKLRLALHPSKIDFLKK